MRAQTPTPNVADLLTGHERRGGHWCWRPRGTPTALLVHTRSGGGVLRGGAIERTISTGEPVLWAPGAPQDFGCHRDAEPWELVWAHFRPRERWHDWLMWPMLDAGIAHILLPRQPNASESTMLSSRWTGMLAAAFDTPPTWR